VLCIPTEVLINEYRIVGLRQQPRAVRKSLLLGRRDILLTVRRSNAADGRGSWSQDHLLPVGAYHTDATGQYVCSSVRTMASAELAVWHRLGSHRRSRQLLTTVSILRTARQDAQVGMQHAKKKTKENIHLPYKIRTVPT